jgi:4-amino-4-deoxychorismate synthase (2-amino-4-deoxychorismate-forming) component I
VTTILAPSDPTLERLMALAGTLEPPFVLLEDGRGAGLTHLVWGAARRARRRFGDPGAIIPPVPDGLPWYGVLSYEAGLPDWVTPGAPALAQPLSDWFVPRNRILVGGDARTVRLDGPEASARWAEASELAAPAPADAPTCVSVPWRAFDEAGFTSAVHRAREYIAAGDVYQVNLAQAEQWVFTGSGWEAYRRLRAANPSPWMGFADFGDWQLVCGSPELLIEVASATTNATPRQVRTRPIAGTRKKTGDAARDAQMRAELRLDEKERAEHLMLVDLARNDLGRISAYGSVHVAEREVVEEYSHLFHLVSEVRGQLRPEVSAAAAVTAVFPGGTITGCPKLRATELIRELEPVGRGAYTGALGWIGSDGLQLNIVIRSAVVSEGSVLVQAGAGIVADSIPEREWRESHRKAEAVRLAFGLSASGPE